ncbi:MAG: DUF4440 domain-containing protein [Acidobacteriota bacterium]
MRIHLTAAPLLAALAAAAAPPSPNPSGVEKADAAMSAACEKRDVAAFAAFLAPDTVFLSHAAPAEGPEAVKAQWAIFFDAKGPALTWKPEKAFVARSGDLAYSVGDWVLREKGESGDTEQTGRYVTVWKKGPAGWLVLFDASLNAPLKGSPRLSPTRTTTSKGGDLSAAIGTFEVSGDGRKTPLKGTYLQIVTKDGNGAEAPEITTCIAEAKPPSP